MIIKKPVYELAPEGLFDAVCVDVIDLGNESTQWGVKPKLRMRFEIDALNKEGKRFVVGKKCTASIHEKAEFHVALKGWFGRGPAKAFDTDALLHKPVRLLIQHDEREGETYANIKSFLKPGEKKLTPSGEYVRQKDRPADQQNGGRRAAPAAPVDDEPFNAPFPGDDDPANLAGDDADLPF